MESRFRLKLFIIMIIFASLIAFSIAIINHEQMKREIKENNQFEVKQIEETIKYSLETIDKVYYFLMMRLLRGWKRIPTT